MWNPNSMSTVDEDESWEVKAFAEDTGNAMGTTWPPRSYTCTFCRREFRSAQALGGHMNVHRRDRARLHQTQLSLKNPNLSLSSSPSSTLLVPSEELVGDSGLCLFFSLPNPNAIFKPLSLNNFSATPRAMANTGTGTSTTGNLMAHRSFNYSLSNSSNNEAASTSIDQVLSLGDKKKKTDLAVEGVDLELRLGCSSSGVTLGKMNNVDQLVTKEGNKGEHKKDVGTSSMMDDDDDFVDSIDDKIPMRDR